MDTSASFNKGKQPYYDMHPPSSSFPYSRRADYEASRSRSKFVKRSATFSYLLLQTAIIAACAAIIATPFWMRCHFFQLTPESVVNGSTPDFFVLQQQNPNVPSVFSQFMAQKQDKDELFTTTKVKTTTTETSKSHPGSDDGSSLAATTAAVTGKKRRHRIDDSLNDSNQTVNNNSSTGGFNHTYTNNLGLGLEQEVGKPMLRKYVSADIGLWETCQMGSCQIYGSLWKIFFEIEPSTWWLFLCRWLCISGVGLTEILWLVVASLRFFYFSRRDQRRLRLSRHVNRPINLHSPEPIAGVLLLLIKLMTLCAITGALVTFRLHANTQWPVEWRTQNGVIAHMGLSWLGLLAMGSCDAWLFLVTLLHTIAERRDRRRAALAMAAQTSANAYLRQATVVSPRYIKPTYCAHHNNNHQHRHHQQANSTATDSILYSPGAFMTSSSQYYKPTPYEDDCDYGFNTVPLSRQHRQSMRSVRNHEHVVTECCHQQQAAASRYGTSNRSMAHRTPGGKSIKSMALSPGDIPRSPLYIPHYDDAAIGGRAFY